jgi:uncharacterized protein DUF997
MAEPREDPVVRSSRREAIVIALIWLAAFAYSVGYCYTFGYDRDPRTLTYPLGLGIPDWCFWGIVVPWVICVGLSWLLAHYFMRDEELGAELEGQDDA